MSDIQEIAEQSRKPREANRLEWAERLARFDSSGMTVLGFCRAEAIAAQSFYYWKRKLADPSTVPPATVPDFLPVRLASSAPVELVLPGGATLRLSPGCDLAFVRSLIDALAGAPC
jgi:transposase